MDMIVRSNSMPLYRQIAVDLMKGIASKKYRPGDRLPSENEIAAKYDTSRVTARKAVSYLKEKGFVSTVPGKGNYYIEINCSIFKFTMFAQSQSRQLVATESKLIEPDDFFCKTFAITRNEKILELTALVNRDDLTIGCIYSYSPYKKGAMFIEKQLNFIPPRNNAGYDNIAISAVNHREAALTLGLEEDAPLIMVQRTVGTELNQPPDSFTQMYVDPRHYELIGTN